MDLTYGVWQRHFLRQNVVPSRKGLAGSGVYIIEALKHQNFRNHVKAMVDEIELPTTFCFCAERYEFE